MTNANHTLKALAEQVQTLQRQVSEQQHTIAQQQEAMSQQQATLTALQVQLEEARHDGWAEKAQVSGRSQAKTSRRRLLTTAGVAAAAAMALGASDVSVAQAATNDDWILGISNDAGATTLLTPSMGMSPSPLLKVNNFATVGSIGLEVSGGSSGGVGVSAEAVGANSIGIEGNTNVGIGVFGSSTSDGFGVYGLSNSLYGVYGAANNIGVYGQGLSSGGVGGYFQGVRAPLSLQAAGSAGAPTSTSGAHNQGDIYLDSATTVWVCTAGGTPGTWVRLTNVLSGTSGGATSYLSKPIRLLDTRSGSSDALNNGGGPYTSGSTHTLTIAGVTFSGVTVPSPIAGAIGKLTATNTTGTGFIALLPHGVAFTGTANLPFSAGETVAIWYNSAVASGKLDLYVSGASTDVILDLFAVVA